MALAPTWPGAIDPHPAFAGVLRNEKSGCAPAGLPDLGDFTLRLRQKPQVHLINPVMHLPI